MNSTKEQGSHETADRTNSDLALWFTDVYRCGFTGNGYNAAMKKALAHLPKEKQNELKRLSPCVQKLHEVTERICKAKIESFI